MIKLRLVEPGWWHMPWRAWAAVFQRGLPEGRRLTCPGTWRPLLGHELSFFDGYWTMNEPSDPEAGPMWEGVRPNFMLPRHERGWKTCVVLRVKENPGPCCVAWRVEGGRAGISLIPFLGGYVRMLVGDKPVAFAAVRSDGAAPVPIVVCDRVRVTDVRYGNITMR